MLWWRQAAVFFLAEKRNQTIKDDFMNVPVHGAKHSVYGMGGWNHAVYIWKTGLDNL